MDDRCFELLGSEINENLAIRLGIDQDRWTSDPKLGKMAA
jgi:hypothetical protein